MALSFHVLQDGACRALGQQNVMTRARLAVFAEDDLVTDIAQRSGRREYEVRATYRSNLNAGLPPEISRRNVPRSRIQYLPPDRHSQWAAHATEVEYGLAQPIAASVEVTQTRVAVTDTHSTVAPVSEMQEPGTNRHTVAGIIRCVNCGQFVGDAAHACTQLPHRLEPRSPSGTGFLRTAPNRAVVQHLFMNGQEVVEFRVGYEFMQTSRDGSDFRAGVASVVE